MMKIIAIFLSNLVLLQSLHFDIKDINKINILFGHAQFHEEKYGDRFFEFLCKHYIDQEISENQKSLSNLTPHPDYVFILYSHPTLIERIKNLRSKKILSLALIYFK